MLPRRLAVAPRDVRRVAAPLQRLAHRRLLVALVGRQVLLTGLVGAAPVDVSPHPPKPNVVGHVVQLLPDAVRSGPVPRAPRRLRAGADGSRAEEELQQFAGGPGVVLWPEG